MTETCVAGTTTSPAVRRSRRPVIVRVDGPLEGRKAPAWTCEERCRSSSEPHLFDTKELR